MGQFNTEQQLTAVTGSKVAASKGRGITGRLETASILLLNIACLSLKHIQGTFSSSFIGSVQAGSTCSGKGSDGQKGKKKGKTER